MKMREKLDKTEIFRFYSQSAAGRRSDHCSHTNFLIFNVCMKFET